MLLILKNGLRGRFNSFTKRVTRFQASIKLDFQNLEISSEFECEFIHFSKRVQNLNVIIN